MGKNEAAAPDLYIRVSGQEQAIKGLSLEAQQEDLEEYARERGWVIVGVYIDAAKTARKRLGKRTNFLRMLEDVKQDKEHQPRAAENRLLGRFGIFQTRPSRA